MPETTNWSITKAAFSECLCFCFFGSDIKVDINAKNKCLHQLE